MELPYSELQALPNQATSAITKVATGVGGAVCQVYHDYKDFYNQGFNQVSPGSFILESFWNNLCPNEPPYSPPPPPSPPFNGGQCVCVAYSVTVEGELASGNGKANYSRGVYGMVGGARLTVKNNSQYIEVYGAVDGCPGSPSSATYWLA